MEQFWINFLANVFAGIVLAIIGFEVSKYYKSKIIKFMQNIQKGSRNIQAGRDVHINMGDTKDSSAKNPNISGFITNSSALDNSFSEKIKRVRQSIIAIGFSLAPGQVTISGSGFCISDDGKVLTAAHIYNQTPSQFQSKLMGMFMTKQEPNGLEHYTWLPIRLIKKEDKDDMAEFQVEDYQKTLLKPLEFGDSDEVDVGEEAYFIGFPYAANLINERFGITLIVNRTIISNVKHDGTNPAHPRNWFIIDAISNPGNSGSPLIDMETNKVIGMMSIAFRIKSQVPKYNDLDTREPMHIAGAKPINLAKSVL